MKRALALITAGALVAMPVLSIGTVQAARPHAGTTITIWEDFPTAALPAMKALATKWATSSGDTISWVDLTQPGHGGNDAAHLLPLKAKSSDAADLIYTTEDAIGGLVASGLLAQRPASLLSAADMASYQTAALGATYVSGVPYSVPQVVDGLLFFYNKKLVPTPPTTWLQLMTMAKKLTTGGQYGFLYDIKDGFYWNGWAFNGYGASVFATKNGKLDPTDVSGLDGPAAVQALSFLKSLTAIVPPSTDSNAGDTNFTAGKAAMTISGPWNLATYAKALGANLGAAPIPTLPDGKPSRPFIGVRVWAVNQFSKHQADAWSLARYLSLNGQLISGKYEGRLPSLKVVPGFVPSPQQVAAQQQYSVGVPIPNNPEMAQVWTPMGTAITLVAQGRAAPRAALDAAQQQMKAGIAKLLQNS